MIYVATRTGENKTESEDYVLVGTSIVSDVYETYDMPNRGFVCVADGVGGNKGGRIASSYVLSRLASINDVGSDLSIEIRQINAELLKKAFAYPVLSEMATTLSGIRITETGYELIHIGNSRVYTKQGRYLKQITTDHTVYNWLKSLGRTEEADYCNKSAITSCLGGGKEALVANLKVSDLHEFSVLLLTTDGIHDYVCVDDIEKIICSDVMSWQKKCEQLVAKALNSGSKDDLSAVLIVNEEA